jgi:hypothetical protein
LRLASGKASARLCEGGVKPPQSKAGYARISKLQTQNDL